VSELAGGQLPDGRHMESVPFIGGPRDGERVVPAFPPALVTDGGVSYRLVRRDADGEWVYVVDGSAADDAALGWIRKGAAR
jgi:hypothetical protein